MVKMQAFLMREISVEMYCVVAITSLAFLQVRGLCCALFNIQRAKEERNDIKHSDTVAALDLYNNIIRNIYSAFQYKTAVEMMKFEFINVYDISCLTGVSLKELKCIELFLGKSR